MQTDGSILSPSDVGNLAGIKPTVGLTSRYLVIPISEHQDTVGPMARSVKDAAYLLQAIAGPDSRDNYTLAIPNNGTLPDYVAACNYNSLRGKTFGVPYNALETFAGFDNLSAPVVDAFYASLDIIRAAGATIVESNFTALDEWLNSNNETIVLEADFINNLATYLAELTYNPNNVTSLAQVREFTISDPLEDYPDRDVGVWDAALALGYNNTDYRFWQAYQADLYLGGEGGLLGAIERGKLDAVLLPTQYAPGFAAIVGAPAVTVPMGFYPANETIVLNQRGDLVATGPNIPSVLLRCSAGLTKTTDNRTDSASHFWERSGQRRL